MDLTKISKDIVCEIQFREKFASANLDSLAKYVEKILKEEIVNILEPENVYQKGQYYDGLGVYIGIVDTYPWGEDYFRREHRFSVDPSCAKVGKVCEINRVLIREIRK